MRRTPLKAVLGGCLAAAMFLPGAASAADTTVRVLASGDGGWVINPDPINATDAEFTDEAASIGAGSLKGGPLGPGPAEKLIAGLLLGMPVEDLSSISYDFLIAGSGLASDASDFYLNVYVNAVNDGKFYDCRYDYVPASGSTTEFTTASFASTDTPTHVQKSGSGRIETCPATLAGASGYFVRAIALNMGDTSGTDNGMVGYLDNVVIATTSGTTTYDFDVMPGSRDDCKNGNWALYGFANQGACVSWVQANPHATK